MELSKLLKDGLKVNGLKGEVREKPKILYFVENYVKPHDLKFFVLTCVLSLMFPVTSRQNRPRTRPPFSPFSRQKFFVALMSLRAKNT